MIFDVRVVEITGYLQEHLEREYKDYVVQETGEDLYYDPKELLDGAGGHAAVADAYHKAVEWARNNRPSLLKTGWKSMQEEQRRKEAKDIMIRE